MSSYQIAGSFNSQVKISPSTFALLPTLLELDPLEPNLPSVVWHSRFSLNLFDRMVTLYLEVVADRTRTETFKVDV